MTARDYLFSLEQFGIKLGLEQIRTLLRHLDHPDRAYRTIVIGGTNGKGSVTAMVERGLRAAGYTTGRYTSPHLIDIEERIAVNGTPIGAVTFDAIAERVRDAAMRLDAPPTFFEATTAIAAEAFRLARVEVAVFEVGLGGRLDATNVLSPVGVAITAVDFDHEEHLGHTLEAIAREKAGIIKTGHFCVLGHNPDPVQQVVEHACRDMHAELVHADEGVVANARLVNGATRVRLRTPRTDFGELTLGLNGRHQVDNAVTAARLLERLADTDLAPISPSVIRTALEEVEWPARLELRQWNGGTVLIDGAHNPAGARALAAYLAEAYDRPLPFVLGVMLDKNIEEMIAALVPRAAVLICTAPASARAADPAELASIARRLAPSLPVMTHASSIEALTAAVTIGTPAVIAGSLYLAGEIRAKLS